MLKSNTGGMVSVAWIVLIALFWQPHTARAQSGNLDRVKHAAPEECVGWLMWNVGQEPPIEGNKTQALMAEPELQAFATDLKRRVGLIAPALTGGSQMPKLKREMLHWLSPKITEAIFDQPGCLFVEEVVVPPGGDAVPKLKAAILLQPKGDVDRFVKRLAAFMKSEDWPSQKVSLAGTDAYQVTLGEIGGDLLFGNAGGICVIALGEATYTGVVTRMKAGKAPAWLQQLEQKASKLNHVHSLGYVNIKSVKRTLRKAFGAQAGAVLHVLGIANVQGVEFISGLNDTGSVVHVLIDTPDPNNLLGLFAGGRVDETMLKTLPSDSLFAGVVSVETEDLLEWIDSIEMMMGQGGGLAQILGEINRELGIDLQDDLLDSLGNSWALYNGSADGWGSGLTLVTEAKAPEKIAQTLERFFVSTAKKTKELPLRYRPRFFKQVHAEETIYSMQVPELFVEPSFCVTDDRFRVALYPQTLISALSDRRDGEFLLDDIALKQLGQAKLSEGATRLTGFAYVDMRTLTPVAYPYLQLAKSVMQSRYGPTRDPNWLALLQGMQFPPARTVTRHLTPTICLVHTGEQGMEVELRQTLPTNGVAVAIPAVAGILLPTVSDVRTAAQNTQSLNNLRQLALGCLNYESAYMQFPGDREMSGEEADHKFSWRVHILPFVEANNVYNQIHFDEPWDSEHNKTLHDQMPEIFKSPLSKAAPGMTVYRGFGGEGGVLGGGERKIGFAQIIDGSSNTILVLEVDDELATPWMKPECLDPDGEVRENIFGNRKSLNSVFCDGSTQKIPATVSPEDLQHLLERNDGNVVDPDFRRNPRRGRASGEAVEADPRFVVPGAKVQY